MGNIDFFKESKDQSKIKTLIVRKYFSSWVNVMINTTRNNKLGYIDLYSGPGTYEDGSKSTPILILEDAINNEKLRNVLVTIFNDANPDFIKNLKEAIRNISNVDLLKNKPVILNSLIDNEVAEDFMSMSLIPSLIFIDPWGYKGLSMNLIYSLLKDWGCDCIFFFNYNRINAAISNSKFSENIFSIFGIERENLQKKIGNKKPIEREKFIIAELIESISKIGGKYVIPFKFIMEDCEKTSHYLIFVSKNKLGYSIMKDIMAKESTENSNGVPNFTFNPHNYYEVNCKQLSLFALFDDPIQQLENDLLKNFKGRRIKMIDIFYEHSINTPYIAKNYKTALLNLENSKKIKTDPPKEKRRPSTMSDQVLIFFE